MTQFIESVFSGGGEMGERMRAFDWSTTALGPVERWPHALRICVRIMLGSGYPMAICWGPDYTLLYNDAQRALFGVKHPTALGRRTRDMFPEAWESVGPLYDRVMMHGQAYTTLTDQLFPLIRSDFLEECYFALSYSPIPDDSGHVGGVFVTGIDTTERVIEARRHHILRDLASRTAEARSEDEVWRLSMNALGEHRLTLPFTLLYSCRPTDRRAYRVGPGIEPGALDPPDIDCTRHNLWGFDLALASEGVVVELGPRASLLPSTSWPTPPERAAIVPIRLHEESDAAGFLVLGIHPGRAFDGAYRQFLRRIAEQVAIGLANARAHEQERRRADALAELDRAKTTFFSNVSHEFRTPLTLMLGPLEEVLPAVGERLGPERHQQLVMVRHNALRLLKLVNTLLDFSRIEAGRVQAVYQPTDLVGLTSDIASMFRSSMESAGLRFSVQCQPIAEPVFVDRGMWEKIVLNLLSNALKFTLEGEVTISLNPVNGGVELQVRDTGVGIPDDQREKVFERFHRIEHAFARTHEGTGIGLALVQELVTLHGGSVTVKSTVGIGSTFTVTIPRGKDHLPPESIQAEHSFASSANRAEAYVEEALRWSPDASSAPVHLAMPSTRSSLACSREALRGTTPEVIVVADDNADMREYLSRLLGERYEVHAVADGQQALEAAHQLRPGLVLAEVMMPRLDGFGLLRAIRDDSALCSTPVILVSARAGEKSRVEGLQADADDYLVKPFTSRELLARVATHMKMAGARRATAEREERLRYEAELQRQKLDASQQLLAQTSRLYRDLSERERESRMIVDTIPGLVATLTPSGDVETVNAQVLAYCGRTLEELKQWATNDIVHPDDLPRAIQVISDSMGSGAPYEIVERLRRFDGVYRWFQVRGLPLRDSNGGIVRWYVLLSDIDDRKKAEEALQSSEHKLRQVIDTIPALAWCNLPDGPNEFLNRGWHEYTGLSEEESHGWGWQVAFHPADLPPLMDKWLKMLVSGESGEIEARLRRHDGVYRWFLIRAQPFLDESGKLVRWYGTSTDIDDRKRAEAEVERAYLHLVEAQRLSRTGSSISDFEKDEHVWSDELYRICELEPGSPITTQRVRDIVHPEDAPLCEAAVRSAMAGASLDLRFRIVTSRGVVKHLHALAHRIADRPVLVGAVQDVTESKMAEEDLSQARSELAHMARVTTLSALTASIGHEVNQPIAALITSADACLRWLNREEPDLHRAREAVIRVQEDGKRAAEIISHLKSFYRKDVSPQREVISANDVVRQMLVLLRSEADRHSVAMRMELAEDLPSVRADRVHLQQVLMNLMLNGMEAMGERGGELTIRTRGERDAVLVSVSDAGPGIPADKLEQIFNAFFTTKVGGTGMGLAISRTIIESHGGRLWATVNPDRGATFHFTLPTEPEA